MQQHLRLLLVALLAPMLLLTACGDGSGDAKPATAEQLVQAGLLQLNQGDTDAALGTFQQAAKKQPDNVFAHYNIGVILQQQGRTAEALAAYGRALAAKPDYVPALFNSAIIYTATDAELAIATYRRIIVLQPQAPTAYLNLGILEAKAGQEAQARKDLATAVKQDGTLVNSIPKDLFTSKSPSSSPAPAATATP